MEDGEAATYHPPPKRLKLDTSGVGKVRNLEGRTSLDVSAVTAKRCAKLETLCK